MPPGGCQFMLEGEGRCLHKSAAFSQEFVVLEISINHLFDQAAEAERISPAQPLRCFRCISLEKVHLRGPVELGILNYKLPVVQANMAKSLLEKLANRMRFAGRDNVIIRSVRLHDAPHCTSVFSGMTPVSLRIEVTES